MAETGIFTTNAIVKYYAGANASAVSTAEAYTNHFISCAESYINALTDYNFSDTYAGLNADVKYILCEAASCRAAMFCINYDLSGFTSRSEVETMLDVLRDMFVKNIELLSKTNVRDFVVNG